MPTERVTFTGHDGADLARLDLPEGPHLATALFAHCFTCSKDIPAARRIAARLAGAGIAVLRFDFTGLGHSEGEFENTTFRSNVTTWSAPRTPGRRGMAPDLLIGHSLGGAAVLAAARRIGSARGVVTIGAPFDPGSRHPQFRRRAGEDRSATAPPRSNSAAARSHRARFRRKREGRDPRPRRSPSLNRALLVLHAPRDTVVGIDNAAEIFKAPRNTPRASSPSTMPIT